MPALTFTLAGFTLILILARLKVPLGLAILLGGMFSGLMLGMGGWELLRFIPQSALKGGTLGLAVISILLVGLSSTMEISGQMGRIVSLAQEFFRRPAVTMAALPALIGLLPMPGGALFSAPMVAEAAKGGQVSAGLLSAINYWYRHIWEYWLPLYPGVVLATTLVGTSLGNWLMFMLPLGVLMTLSGLSILVRVHPNLRAGGPKASSGTKRRLLMAVSPVWIILLVWAPIGFFAKKVLGSFPSGEVVQAVTMFGPLSAGIFASVILTSIRAGLDRKTLRSIWTGRGIYEVAGLVIAVRIFEAVLSHVGAPGRIGAELTGARIPLVIVVATLPFIAGMVTGLAIGFVGTSFPIVLGLVAAGQSPWPFVVLGYAFGHQGQMLSPVHMCHVLSNRYFDTPFPPVYRCIVPAVILNMTGAVGYAMLLNAILN